MIDQPITEAHAWLTGEDRIIEVVCYEPGTTLAQITAGTAIPLDVSALPLSWRLKRRLRDGDDASLLHKTTASGIDVVGTYAPTQGANTQRVQITIAAEDTRGNGSTTPAIPAGTYWHELKRAATPEQILVQGDATLQQAVHRAAG